jgi:RecA/RadA recombinase
MPPIKKPAKENEEPKITPESILGSELTRNKEDHLNFEEEVYYKVSTGSLSMDIETKGGVNPGVFVVSGPFESGKTSFTLSCIKNMLDTMPDARALYVKAEGRLSPEMQERTGIKFVFKAEEWVDGTCFVLETNVWEFTLNILRRLIVENEAKRKYFFFIDSMDGMSLRDDIVKDVGTANKVAGGPLLTKQFLQKMANAMAKRGHICALAGQVSANIQLDPYSPTAPRSGPGGGGNAKDHWGNHIFIFRPKSQSDLILEKPSEKPDRLTNPIVGHKVKILIKKSPNEKSGITVEYPVKYGRSEGKSVWTEYEIVDALLMFDLLKKKGSWLAIDESIRKELADAGHGEVPVQIQGLDNWRKYLEDNPGVSKHLFTKFQKMIGGS